MPPRRKQAQEDLKLAKRVTEKLNGRAIVMVGLMGCGKSSIGRRIANRLHLPFVDADDEIVVRAGQSIADIFQDHGEAFFRDREKLVIASLLEKAPLVLATGGGAFTAKETREVIKKTGISIWLKAELPVLLHRVARRSDRPLLQTGDPKTIMRDLMAERYPIYAEADITIESRDVPHEVIVSDILRTLADSSVLETDAPDDTAHTPDRDTA